MHCAPYKQLYQVLLLHTQGDAWTTRTNWGSNIDHCEWFGVLCCGSSGSIQIQPQPALSSCLSPGAVLAVALPGNNLQGTLSADFFSNVKSLVYVDLRGMLQLDAPSLLGSASSCPSLIIQSDDMQGTI